MWLPLGLAIPMAVPLVDPTKLMRPLFFIRIASAYSRALLFISFGLSLTVSSYRFVIKSHSSPSQNISESWDACLPNFIYRSDHLAGLAKFLSMTQVIKITLTE